MVSHFSSTCKLTEVCHITSEQYILYLYYALLKTLSNLESAIMQHPSHLLIFVNDESFISIISNAKRKET